MISALHGPANLSAVPLMDGDAGTEQTIRDIRRLVDEGQKDAYVVGPAIEILRSSGASSWNDEEKAQTIYSWVLRNVYYVSDPVTKEALRRPRDILNGEVPGGLAGDCDDINGVLIPSLLMAVGINARVVTVASEPSDPGAFTHIYAEAFLNGEWVPMDAARPDAAFGLAPGRFYRREWWSLEDDSHGDYDSPQLAAFRRRVSGLGRLGQSVATDVLDALDAGLAAAPNILRAADGTPVYSAIAPAYGPGGTTLLAPATSAQLNATASASPLLLLLGAGVVLWLLTKK